MFDSIIIGMGPAGIEAGIYLKRYGLNALVIGKDLGALEKAHEIENYYGVGKLSGLDLAKNALKNALNLDVMINKDEVIAIEYGNNFFDVKTTKNEYQAKTILIATGKARNSFQLAKQYEGKGISYCATCDGFFYRKKKIGIVGYNEYMVNELNALLPLTKDITVFTNGEKLKISLPNDIAVITSKITKLGGDDKLEFVLCDDKKYQLDGLFIALGSQNAFTLAKHLGLEINNNNLVVNQNYMTNIPGIFAAGDVIGGLLQVVKAASDGANAAYNIKEFLRLQND